MSACTFALGSAIEKPMSATLSMPGARRMSRGQAAPACTIGPPATQPGKSTRALRRKCDGGEGDVGTQAVAHGERERRRARTGATVGGGGRGSVGECAARGHPAIGQRRTLIGVLCLPFDLDGGGGRGRRDGHRGDAWAVV